MIWRSLSTFILTLTLTATLSRSIILAQTPLPSPMATASSGVNYYLAFPGMLPDQPFYKLKVLRDKLRVAFTRNPRRHIELYLLAADKGILATAMLIDKGKFQLANETALKAEHNMTLVTYYLPRLKLKEETVLVEKLITASRKHQEVLGVITDRVPTNQQNTLKTVLEFSNRNLQSIKQLVQEAQE